MSTGKLSNPQIRVEQQFRRIQQQLIGGALSLVGVFLLGSSWYHLVEGWRWLDAAYMTVITLATVGFLEVNPLGDRGRIFTIVLILLGVISIGYIVNRFTDALIQGYFQEGLRLRRLQKQMEKLSDHYIICGFGRMGQQIATEFQAEGITFVVADFGHDPVVMAEQLGYTAIQGDATLDETLIRLQIEQATCLIAALPSDAENLYTVLSAKTLNPSVRAIARASTEEALVKLQRAGADAVVSPYITGGKRMASAALRPQVMDFVDGILSGGDRTFYMEEFELTTPNNPYVGQTLREAKLRSQSGALVLAIRRLDGTPIVGPNADTVLMQGDHLICMGTADQIRLLNQILFPMKTAFPRPPKKS
ncbi:potassium channel protein [Phormidium sp. CLA17]|uniref:potassium channel family protein n=1 Tax=Leptolyngbya sp. Cla-17 TaxID=2803751 RepID=UPI00149254EC|nr:potassium channel protein [Leptolyngbya sp. Cla-17]MBM0742400.1 potassium channel protein [Leptolyngbya sp. Cla-17]